MNEQIERAILTALDSVKLSQTVWEDSEDVMTFNGKPVGATVTGRLQIDRWWGRELKAELAKYIASVVAPAVMCCADCQHWEIARECQNYQEGNRYGKCKNPIVQCELKGDAYIKEYVTGDLQFCSNFERRSA